MRSIITDKWNQYLTNYNSYQNDIYYCEEYVKLYETQNSKALCAICFDNMNILLMPFIRKEIEGYFDFETPYGYGGPISNSDNADWISLALFEMKLLFEREKFVCGFIRFHPLLENAKYFENCVQTIFDRNTVVINTEKSETEIWENQIISKNRNMIKKAEKNGLVYKAEYDFESLPDFIKLYNSTMERVGAESFYFFKEDYYYSLVNNFRGKAFLGTVRKDDELICAALFMYLQDYGHYHLEGSNHMYSSLGANNLLLWKTALEMKKLGVKRFHLGGGYNSDSNNSLLKFKKSFSNNLMDFYIGKWIFNEEKYLELKEEWAENNPDKVEKFGGLLLCYRY